MIGIQDIAVYRPSDRIDNYELAEKHSASSSFLESKVGFKKLSRLSGAQSTTDMAKASVETLFDKNSINPENIECMVLVTQNPDNHGLPHSSAILHAKLGLQRECAVFDVSLGCSGYVQGLTVIKALMESLSFRNGLLVTADPYSKIVDLDDRDTSMIFGDGATATWMSDAPNWAVGANDFGIQSASSDALNVNAEGKLHMNGRAVFNFAASEVPGSIDRVLAKSEVSIDDIDTVLLHQGSRFIVETIANRIGAEDKTPFVAAEYGNTVSSSIPMLLAENVPLSARRVLISGFGVGLAWATCMLERVEC